MDYESEEFVGQSVSDYESIAQMIRQAQKCTHTCTRLRAVDHNIGQFVFGHLRRDMNIGKNSIAFHWITAAHFPRHRAGPPGDAQCSYRIRKHVPPSTSFAENLCATVVRLGEEMETHT